MENVKYIRTCKHCGKQMVYKSYSAWYLGNKNNSLCKSCSAKLKVTRVGDLSILLNDSLETYYWIGFLLADGSFTNNRLELTLSSIDSDHLYKFAKYIKYTGSYGKSDAKRQVYCKNVDIVPKICTKFDIQNNKTYNPPKSLLRFSESQNIALLCGFIDGDGYIQKHSTCNSFRLSIKVHKSWFHILQEFDKLISNTSNHCRINSQGYAVLIISNSEMLKKFKLKILEFNLPFMSRKWDKVDLTYTSKYVIAEKLRNQVIDLYKSGMSQKEISQKCQTSIANIIKILKKYKNGNN